MPERHSCSLATGFGTVALPEYRLYRGLTRSMGGNAVGEPESVVMLSPGHSALRLLRPMDLRLHVAPDAARLLSTLRSTGAAVVLVSASFDGDSASASTLARVSLQALVAELRARAPHLLVVVLHESSGRQPDVRALEGDSALLDLTSHDATRQLWAVVQRVSRRARLARAADAFAAGANAQSAWLLRQLVERAFDPLRIGPWVRTLPVSRATANRRLRQAFGISLEPAMLWGRLLAATVELEHTLLRVADVAYALGYEDSTGLTQATRSLMGCGVRDLIGKGGSSLVVQCWHERSRRVGGSA